MKTLSFAASITIHLLFLGSVAFFPQLKSTLPLGVNRKGDATVIELGSPASERRTAPRVVRSSDDVVVKQEVEPSQGADTLSSRSLVTSDNAQFGSATGTVASGQVGVSNGSEVSEKERYLYELRRLIDGRKIYPSLAKRLRQTGEVIVQFKILKDGSIRNVEVVRPSQHERLNKAASQLIASIQTYKPLPASTGTEQLLVTVPVEYTLY